VLVVAADDDVVLPAHTVEVAGALPDAQLAVVPGTSHLLVHEKPQFVTALIRDFLDDPRAHRIMPMERPASRD
jgi:pimeloyl-ACP methyl ester carboxylesterase